MTDDNKFLKSANIEPWDDIPAATVRGIEVVVQDGEVTMPLADFSRMLDAGGRLSAECDAAARVAELRGRALAQWRAAAIIADVALVAVARIDLIWRR